MAKKKHKKKSKPPSKSSHHKAEFSNSDFTPFLWREYALKCFCPVLIIIATAIMAWWSWETWCDPMIDFGRELYVPWQITEGKTLYTDIAYFNGPFSPYFNSLWFLLLGVYLRSLLFVNFLILILMLFFSYQLLNEIGSKSGATFGCLIIVTVFGFAKYHFIGGYNFIAPYSHEMIHGLLLSIIGIWCLSKYHRQNKDYFILLSGTMLGLVFLTKAEFAIAAAISFSFGLALIFWSQKKPMKHIAIKLILFLTGVIIPPFIAFLLLFTRMPASQAFLGILGSWVGTLKPELRKMIFYRQLMGLDTIGPNTKTMFVSFGYLVLFYVPAIVFSVTHQTNKKRDIIIGLILLGGTIVASIIFINRLISIGPFMLRPLPIVLIGLIIAEATRFIFQHRKNSQDPISILRITLLTFALLLLLKIILRTDPSQYGFALAMPGTIIMVSALVDWLPASLGKKDKAGDILRFFSIGVIIVFSGIHVLWSGFWYTKTNVEINSNTATFYADFRGNIVNEIINEIETDTSSKDTLAVLPEGVMLNFLTQRENSTPYINFMPPEFALFGESNMLNAFKTNPPDYIVLTNKSLKEYGFQELGIDIGVNLYQWIDKNYDLIKNIEPEVKSNLPFTHMRFLRRKQSTNFTHSNTGN